MPPPKGKKNKKPKEEDDFNKCDTSETNEQEYLLQQELDGLNAQLDGFKTIVDELRQENDWLQQEAHRVRVESGEYMNYMEKKTSKRQTTIVTLSDQNQKEINDLLEQKNVMLKEYEEKKAVMRIGLLEKESLHAKAKEELSDLHEYKNLQQEQLQKIRDLESEVLRLRSQHNEAIQQLKSKFLREKNDYKQDAEVKIDVMARQANKEALDCLSEHTSRIKLENRELRAQLLTLIQHTRQLHARDDELQQHKKQIVREQQYARDLKRLRGARRVKASKTLERESDDGSRSGTTEAPHKSS